MNHARRPWVALLLLLPLAVDAKPRCTVSATSMVFGSYNPFSALPADISGTITLACDKSKVDFRISLSPGVGGTYFQRQLSGAEFSLVYQLYLDAAHSIVWGDGSAGTDVAIGTIEKGATEAMLTVHGVIAPLQNVAPGSYLDTIVVTAEF